MATSLLRIVGVIALLGFSMQSCKMAASFDDLGKVAHGQTPAEVSDIINLDPIYTFSFTEAGQTYVVEAYPVTVSSQKRDGMPQIQTDGYKKQGDIYVRQYKRVQTTYTESTDIPFVFLYRENRAIYWGFLNDFSKSDDPQIERIAAKLYQEYQKIVDIELITRKSQTKVKTYP